MDKTLEQQLLCLAHYVRDPAGCAPPPGMEARRLAIYRRLFYGNIEAMLASGFPVLSASLGSADWHRLVQDFYAHYRCQTPLFTELASEFVLYLEQGAGDGLKLPQWLSELAHYERVESVLLLSNAQPAAVQPMTATLDTVLALSDLAWPLAYQWPVCDIGPGHLPKHPLPEPTLLLAQRKADHKVHFSRLAPLVYTLLVSVQHQQWTGRQHLAALADSMGVTLDAVLPQGQALLEQLVVQGVISG
ncbi:MAG TPA: putative DNA-binding domain-containing protein [Rheinheimera sp.]|uniref:HvfC family RiPP maturation protein n=1 Tax=Rheinheimera sp. TaxID=1869214 RepID=UPI002B48E0D3|nr:putative DNA-binding domain-containing protein [Rheinheimera sp.]HJS15144.1 putative DNA-binding domain-containing protein [Rheinheimera sp.]